MGEDVVAEYVGAKDLAEDGGVFFRGRGGREGIDDVAGGGAFEGGPGGGGDDAGRENVVEDLGPVETVPTAHAGVEDDRVEAGDLDVVEGDEGVVIVAVVGAGHGARDELVGGAVYAGKVTQVDLDAEDVDSPGCLFRIVARAGAGSEGFRCRDELFRMLPQAVDGLLGLFDTPCSRDENEV